MFDRLFEQVSGLPENEVGEVALQDIANCGLWRHSVTGDSTSSERSEAIGRAIEWLLYHATIEQAQTEGRRPQWVLWDPIDEPSPSRGAMIETANGTDAPRTYYREMGKVVAAS